MAQPESTSQSARRMLDQYEIVAEIASGGMGTVYLARLARKGGFQRMVALKLLHRHLAEEKHFVTMLLDEARLAARLHHPNAVGILDVRESELGYYLVMDYVDGFAMDDVLERARSHEERMRVGLRILLDASTGLDAAHNLRDDDGRPLEIVHRDVSPQNILVGRDGVGRITDFGVARAAERITASRPGTIKGKPCYMAPEQAECRELDARADLFALGIVLWETLTGQLLFESDAGTMSILLAVLQRPIPSPSEVCPEVPEVLTQVCLRALERDPSRRFQTGREFIDALSAAAAQCGMLVGAHHVSDAIRDMFAVDLEARQAAVRAHVSAIDKLPVRAMTLGDLHRVPKLGSLPDLHALHSGVRSSGSSDEWFEHAGGAPAGGHVDPTSQTIALRSGVNSTPAPAPDQPPSAAPGAGSSHAWRVAWVSLLLGALIAIGGLVAFRLNQSVVVAPPTQVASPEGAPSSTPPASAVPAELAPAESPPVGSAPEAAADEPAPRPEPEGDAAPPSALAQPEAEAEGANDLGGATPESAPRRRRDRGATPRAPRSADGMATPPPTEMSAPSPGATLEANPYTR